MNAMVIITNLKQIKKKKKNTSKKANKTARLKDIRDLFAYLLYLAVAEKVFWGKMVIIFPLACELAEFVHPDGTI